MKSRAKLILTVLEPVFPSDYMKTTICTNNMCALTQMHNLLTKLVTGNQGIITGNKKRNNKGIKSINYPDNNLYS